MALLLPQSRVSPLLPHLPARQFGQPSSDGDVGAGHQHGGHHELADEEYDGVEQAAVLRR